MPKSARLKPKPPAPDVTLPTGDAQPDASWSLDTLASYAKGEVANSKAAEKLAILQAKKSAVHLFRAGHALFLAREQCKGEKHGDWAKFKRKYGLAGTSANDAIRLFENVKTEESLDGLGITEAKVKFVYPPKQDGPAAGGEATGDGGTPGGDQSTDVGSEDKHQADESTVEGGTPASDTVSEAKFETLMGRFKPDGDMHGGGKSPTKVKVAYKLTVVSSDTAELEKFGKLLPSPITDFKAHSVSGWVNPSDIGTTLAAVGASLGTAMPKAVRVVIER